MSLEPIEDKDLDLKSKFTESAENIPAGKPQVPLRKEVIVPDRMPERKPERKEGSAEKEAMYSKILSKVKTPVAPADDAIVDDAKSASEESTSEAKIDKLIKLAINKGVIHAVKVARHLDDNYALDEFHDKLLSEELHDALTKKGLIKEL